MARKRRLPEWWACSIIFLPQITSTSVIANVGTATAEEGHGTCTANFVPTPASTSSFNSPGELATASSVEATGNSVPFPPSLHDGEDPSSFDFGSREGRDVRRKFSCFCPEQIRSLAAPSRNTCFAFVHAFTSPISTYIPGLRISSIKNRLGGSVSARNLATSLRQMAAFRGQFRYWCLYPPSIASSRNLTLPGRALTRPPRPQSMSSGRGRVGPP
mmetsp:Transcript_57236/g.121487  ORF Transcript_57236/g.121487 Transcript_57236/m.121487 type:complete len:216 (+) Transcript_57236:1213-1860(+)